MVLPCSRCRREDLIGDFLVLQINPIKAFPEDAVVYRSLLISGPYWIIWPQLIRDPGAPENTRNPAASDFWFRDSRSVAW